MLFFQVKDMREGEVEHFFSTHPVTGHYTQLAWAKTYEIGCGFLSHRRHEGGPLISVSHNILHYFFHIVNNTILLDYLLL